MARSLNIVNIMGNMTRDPELRKTSSGQSVVNISVALNRAYKNKDGEWQEETDYVDVVAWSNLAERISEFLGKGSRVLVNGRLQSRSWEQDGQKRSKLEIVANDVIFLDNKPKNKEDGSIEKSQKEVGTNTDNDINPSDIPF